MSESDQSSQKDVKIVKEPSLKSIQKQKSIIIPTPVKQTVIQDQTGLYDQNRKLRRKLKQLSARLDEQLQKAAENKLKQNNIKNGHPVSIQSHGLELQNAYKMIERLQKTVKDYQSKESYQVTLKRVMDLQGIIKKKQTEIEELKTQVKTQKKMLKDKDKHIEELIENSKKMNNPAEDMELINKLKTKMKKILEQNDHLRKKQLTKHSKLVEAERKIVEMEQNDNQMPIARQQNLLKEVQEYKNKYKDAMQRVERQNIYISKLNQKLNNTPPPERRRSQKQSERQTQRKYISKSMQDLPDLKKKIIPTAQLLQHLPSPKGGMKLRRY